MSRRTQFLLKMNLPWAWWRHQTLSRISRDILLRILFILSHEWKTLAHTCRAFVIVHSCRHISVTVFFTIQTFSTFLLSLQVKLLNNRLAKNAILSSACEAIIEKFFFLGQRAESLVMFYEWSLLRFYCVLHSITSSGSILMFCNLLNEPIMMADFDVCCWFGCISTFTQTNKCCWNVRYTQIEQQSKSSFQTSWYFNLDFMVVISVSDCWSVCFILRIGTKQRQETERENQKWLFMRSIDSR